jgi:hypothetical protein
VCPSSLIANLKYTFIIPNLQSVLMMKITRVTHPSRPTVYTHPLRAHYHPVQVSAENLLSICSLLCCGVPFFPYYLKPERWVHGSRLARKISFLARPSSCQEGDLFHTVLAINLTP